MVFQIIILIDSNHTTQIGSLEKIQKAVIQILQILHGFILGHLLFLIYENYMSYVVKSNLLLYDDDSFLVLLRKNVKEIEKQLNEDFTNIYEWFVNNKINIHFGEDKTKSLLFVSKRKIK